MYESIHSISSIQLVMPGLEHTGVRGHTYDTCFVYISRSVHVHSLESCFFVLFFNAYNFHHLFLVHIHVQVPLTTVVCVLSPQVDTEASQSHHGFLLP